jgi:hypothetical protein
MFPLPDDLHEIKRISSVMTGRGVCDTRNLQLEIHLCRVLTQLTIFCLFYLSEAWQWFGSYCKSTEYLSATPRALVGSLTSGSCTQYPPYCLIKQSYSIRVLVSKYGVQLPSAIGRWRLMLALLEVALAGSVLKA